MVRGFNQEHGVDFNENFAPTAQFWLFMRLFAIKVKYLCFCSIFDVAPAYPHSLIDEEIYILPPDDYLCDLPGKVLQLCQALYGTKEASGYWWKFFSKVDLNTECAYCVNY